MSPKSAGLAVKMGYTNVKVMLQGDPGWEESGNLLVATDDFVAKGNIVLVDLRAPAEVVKGHIARAVNIPAGELKGAQARFPSSRSAPIVLYGPVDAVQPAWSLLREWGFKKVSAVDGGLTGWQERGRPVATGPTSTEIAWVRTLAEGEVSLDEFRQVVETNPPDKVILDVRTEEEAAAGKLKNAVHIPLDFLAGRAAELPRDREVLIHCTTGARAEMAQQLLKKAGVKSRFLMANVDCQGEQCSISE